MQAQAIDTANADQIIGGKWRWFKLECPNEKL